MTDPHSYSIGFNLDRSQDYSAVAIVEEPVRNPKTAHDSFSRWRERDHGDHVLATAIARWFGEARYARTEARYAKEERKRLKAHWYSNSEVNESS
jgi:hypothetical protein